ncbi:tetratricopeptide repeat protein, partial [Acidobacteria bacterium AH-259-G07]|nr:tetratricopeptide repeat protein [Acidobacteria bacterium AH-259-G07]
MRLRTALLSILVVSAVVWVYWPSKDFPFQFDDALFLRDDNVTLARWQAFVWPPKPRLLAWLSFLIQYQIHGSNPMPYHAVNIFLHALNALLVFVLLSHILETEDRTVQTRFPFLPLFGALLFVLHPLQSEAVLYIYQRSTLLAACFAFLTLVAYLSDRPKLTLVFLVLALCSKEFTVVLPLILWSMDGLLRQKWKPGRWLTTYLVITLSVGLGFLIWVLTSQDVTLGGDLGKSAAYAATQVRVLWSYIGLTLFPVSLNLDHHVAAQRDFLDPSWWLALMSLAALFWLALRLRERSPKATFFVFVFFAFLLPTSSFVPSRDYLFEHRVYASLLGFSGLLSLVLGASWRMLKARLVSGATQQRLAGLLVGLATTVPLVTYGVIDRDRLKDWSNEVALWRDTAEKSPNKYRPNYNLGVTLMEHSPREAIVYLSRAISIDPGIPLAYRSLGEVCFKLGNLDAAEQFWNRALELNPDHAKTYLALGRLYAQRLDFFRAHQHLQRAQKLDSSDWRSYFHLARLNLRFGFWEKAVIQSEMGLNRDPDHVGLRLLLADSVAQTRNWDRAIELYQELLARDPGNSLIYYKLAQVYWTTRRQQQALETVREGIANADSELESAQGKSLL